MECEHNTGQNGTIVNAASGELVMLICGTAAGADTPIGGGMHDES